MKSRVLSVVPVLDDNKQYKGVITNRKLLYTIAKSAAVQSVGGVIVLEMNNNDYSLTEISFRETTDLLVCPDICALISRAIDLSAIFSADKE